MPAVTVGLAGAREGTPSPDGANRRQEIVQAAMAALVERGFEGLRVREVAGRVGINIATLHYYFPTKDALIQGVVDVIVAGFGPVLPADHAPLTESSRLALRAHLAQVLDQQGHDPGRFIVLNELFVRAARDPRLRQILVEIDREWRAYLIRIIAAGIAAGEFQAPARPDVVADILMSLLKGNTLQFGIDGQDAAQAVDQIERWLAAS